MPWKLKLISTRKKKKKTVKNRKEQKNSKE